VQNLVNQWQEGTVVLSQFNVDLRNVTQSVVPAAKIRIIGTPEVRQAWCISPMGSDQQMSYGFPNWIAENGGLKPGETLTFGFICVHSNAVRVTANTASHDHVGEGEGEGEGEGDASNVLEGVEQFLKRWPADKYADASKASGGDGSCVVYDAGASLAANKARVLRACDTLFTNTKKKNGQSADLMKRVVMAYAFIETSTLSASERDFTKDPGAVNFCGAGGVNYSAFNLNYQMIKDIGLPDVGDSILMPDNPSSSILNTDTDEGVMLAVRIIVAGLKKWGLDLYVSYLRGGTTLFESDRKRSENYDLSGGRFKVTVFKCGMSKIVEMIVQDTSLMTDSRRACLNIPWV
jgi:hypothetical protein